MQLLPWGPVANVTGMVMLLWTYIHKDMFGGGGGVVGLLGRMGFEGKWVDKTTP